MSETAKMAPCSDTDKCLEQKLRSCALYTVSVPFLLPLRRPTVTVIIALSLQDEEDDT